MPLKRVNFNCPKCGMYVKAEHPKVQVDKTDDFVQYGHERCYKRTDELEKDR